MADEKKTLSGEELEKVSGGWIIKMIMILM